MTTPGERSKRRYFVQVDPMLASEWLARNHPLNRRIRSEVVEKYADAMRRGEWRGDNGITISFSKEGLLLNGQHRLLAVCKTGLTIELEVLYDQDESVMHTMDVGVKRTMSDVYRLNGIGNNSQAAACVKLYLKYKAGAMGRKSFAPTEGQMVEVAEERTDHLQAAVNTAAAMFTTCPLNRSVAGAAHLLFSEIDEDDCLRFFDDLRYGTNLRTGDPVLALRNLILRNVGAPKHRQFDNSDLMAATVKAWNSYRAHRSLQVLRVRTNEFPVAA